jgi:hypothetical protein
LVRVNGGGVDELLGELAAAAARVASVRAERDRVLSERDELVRAALAAGATYAALTKITRLSRASLDTIRRGARGRGSLYPKPPASSSPPDGPRTGLTVAGKASAAEDADDDDHA